MEGTQQNSRELLFQAHDDAPTTSPLRSRAGMEVEADLERNFDQDFVNNVENNFAAAFPIDIRPSSSALLNNASSDAEDDDPHQVIDEDVDDPYYAVLELIDSISSILSISKYDMLLTDNEIGNIHTGRIPISFNRALPNYASAGALDEPYVSDDDLPPERMELVPCNADKTICGMQVYSPYVRSVFMLPQRERQYKSVSQLPTLLAYILAYGQMVEMTAEKLYPITTRIWDVYQSLRLALLLVQDRIRLLQDGPVRFECSFLIKGRGQAPIWPTPSGMSMLDCIATVENDDLKTYFDNVFLHLVDPLNPLFHEDERSRDDVKTPDFIRALLSLNTPYKATLIYHTELLAHAFCDRSRKGIILNSLSLAFPDSSLYRLDDEAFCSDEECLQRNSIGIRLLNPRMIPLTNYEACAEAGVPPSQAFRVNILASACSHSVRCPGPFVSFLTDLLEMLHRFSRGSCSQPEGGAHTWHQSDSDDVSLFDAINYAALFQISTRSRRHLFREICNRLTDLYQDVMKWTLWNRAGRSRSRSRLGWNLDRGPPTHTGQLDECISSVASTSSQSCLMKYPQDNVWRDARVFAQSIFGEQYHSDVAIQVTSNRRPRSRRSWDRCPVRKAAYIVVTQLSKCKNTGPNEDDTAWTANEFENYFIKAFCRKRKGVEASHRPIFWRTMASDQLKDPWQSCLADVPREPMPILFTLRPQDELAPRSGAPRRKGPRPNASRRNTGARPHPRRSPSRTQRLLAAEPPPSPSPLSRIRIQHAIATEPPPSPITFDMVFSRVPGGAIPWYWEEDTGNQLDEFWHMFTGGNDSHINKVIIGRALLSIYIQNSQFDNEWKVMQNNTLLADVVLNLDLLEGCRLGFFFFDKTRARTAVSNVAKSLFIGSIQNSRLFHGKDISDLRQITAWLLEEVPPCNRGSKTEMAKYRRAATAWKAIMSAYGNSQWQNYLNLLPTPHDDFPADMLHHNDGNEASDAIDDSVSSAGNSLEAIKLRRVGKLVNETGCMTENLFKFLFMHRALYCIYFLPMCRHFSKYYDEVLKNRVDMTSVVPENPIYHHAPIHRKRSAK